MTKKIIKGTEREIALYEFEGALKHLKEQLQEWIDIYGEDAEIEYDQAYYYPYESTPTAMMLLKKDREETDKEYAERTEEEAKWQLVQEKRDRAEFERLQKKFGQ